MQSGRALGRLTVAARRAKLACVLLALGLLISAASRAADDSECDASLVLQILGSGGPDSAQARAGSSYLLRIDGAGWALLDAGPGTLLALSRAEVDFADLHWIAISHLHVDHVADLVSILKAGYFSGREAPLPLYGPVAAGAFPDFTDYLQRLLGPHGAYAYLAGYLDGSDGLVALQPRSLRAVKPERVRDKDGLRLDALAVPHGPVPALAYRITVRGRSVVVVGDTTASGNDLIAFARNADVLVMHLAIPESAGSVARSLHAPPSRIGEVAAAAAPGRLVLSHLMERSLAQLPDALQRIRERYRGPIQVAQDGLCVPLDRW